MSLINISRAYDQGVAEYDSSMRSDHWMRRMIWRQCKHAFKAGDHILDLGCGTGIDSYHLLKQGMKVTALDASKAMLESHKKKYHGGENIEFQQGDLTQLEGLPNDHFDGVVSSFAALNTVDDWPQWQRQVNAILKPKAQIVFHMLNAGDIWQDSERRQQTEREIAINGQPVRHYFHNANQLYHDILAENFNLKYSCQFSFLLPYAKRYRLPSWINLALGELENLIGRLSNFEQTGRFVLMRLQKRD